MLPPVDLSLRPDLRRPELNSPEYQARLNPGHPQAVRQTSIESNRSGEAGDRLGPRASGWERMAAFQAAGGFGLPRGGVDYGSNRARSQLGASNHGSVEIDGQACAAAPATGPALRPGLTGHERSAVVNERAALFEERARPFARLFGLR
jgi:hypothetical protein